MYWNSLRLYITEIKLYLALSVHIAIVTSYFNMKCNTFVDCKITLLYNTVQTSLINVLSHVLDPFPANSSPISPVCSLLSTLLLSSVSFIPYSSFTMAVLLTTGCFIMNATKVFLNNFYSKAPYELKLVPYFH